MNKAVHVNLTPVAVLAPGMRVWGVVAWLYWGHDWAGNLYGFWVWLNALLLVLALVLLLTVPAQFTEDKDPALEPSKWFRFYRNLCLAIEVPLLVAAGRYGFAILALAIRAGFFIFTRVRVSRET